MVDRLAGDVALRGRLVDRGRATAAAFDVERLTDCFEGWLEAAVSGDRAHRPADRAFRIEDDDVRA